MSFSFGNNLKISIFGESHSPAIGMSIDGLPAGLKIDLESINNELNKRLGQKDISTPRREEDQPEFISGLFNGHTVGSPLVFILKNKDVDSSKYVEGQIRPSHCDFTMSKKYNGFNDYRGGGFSSGRITASLVVLGSICNQIIKDKGIKIASHIKQIKDVEDRDFNSVEDDINSLSNLDFAVLDNNVKNKMIDVIKDAAEKKDSVGGLVETVIYNAPIGLGEPYFNSFESVLSHLLFSLGGIKGVEFGDGFNSVKKMGSEVSDGLQLKNNEVTFLSNHNGGINGGISNGEPIIFRCAIKPAPSIKTVQQSINLKTNENINLELDGRFDSCFVHRVLPVINAISAYVVVELFMAKKCKEI